MPIVDAEITFRLSGGAGNSNPNLSLGGVMSSTVWTGGTLHDLFDVISGDDNATSKVDYRCVYIRNGNATLAWGPNIKIWFSAVTAGGADLSIGVDPAGAGNGSTTGVATTIANENAVPAGVSFTTQAVAIDKASGISGPASVPASNVFALWIKREAKNSAAANNDGATIQIQGDTPA